MKHETIIAQYRALGIPELEKLSELHELPGSYVNLEYTLPSGQRVKLLDDNKTYLGNEICKQGSDRCYGLAADEEYLLLCEYGCGGSDAEIIVFQRLNRT